MKIARTFGVDPGFSIPALDGVGGCVGVSEPARSEILACYFDTADLALAAATITLRRRTGNLDVGWTLTLPGGDDAAREISAPLDQNSGDVPAVLALLVAGHVRGRQMTPVADVTTVRVERGILGDGGRTLATLTDDRVTGRRRHANDARQAAATWRELKVEGVTGSTASINAFGARLRDGGARSPVSISTLHRLLGGAVTPSDQPGAAHSAGATLIAFVRTQARQLQVFDPMVRMSNRDDDSVHLMRVTTRGIYYALRAHRRLLDPDHLAPLHTELRWLAGVLGEVRDLEVMRTRLCLGLAEIGEEPEAPSWMTALRRKETQARSSLRTCMSSARYFALLDDLDGLIARPPFTPKADRTATAEALSVVRSAWRKMSRAESAIGGVPAGELRDTALHTLRKKAKRGVQAAQAATALGVVPVEVSLAAARLEALLGGYRDASIAQQQLQRLTTDPATTPGEADVLGRLACAERCQAEKTIGGLPSTWQQVSFYTDIICTRSDQNQRGL